MKIFIVGASGLVGSHCFQKFKANGCSVIGTHLRYKTINTVYFDPLDELCEKMLVEFNPDVILHCGALTHVDYCEENEEESYKLTVESTRVLRNFCVQNSVKMVYFSTDYIFDGQNGPYRESDTPSPLNIYGQHKLQAENLVKELEEYLILRITNVYGEEEREKNFIERLIGKFTKKEKCDFSIPFDQFATPIYAGDIAQMVYQLLLDRKVYIYHLAATDFYSRYSLALKVKTFYPQNKNISITPIATCELNQLATRPLNGGLLNNKFSSEYPDFEYTNIDNYIKKRYEL